MTVERRQQVIEEIEVLRRKISDDSVSVTEVMDSPRPMNWDSHPGWDLRLLAFRRSEPKVGDRSRAKSEA